MSARTSPAPSPATLGDVLYANPSQPPIAEEDWVALVRSIAARNQLALHALYERTHRIVFTLIMRIVGNRQTAEELTLDVYDGIWRGTAGYDTEAGTVVGWVMNQARAVALARLRLERAQQLRDALEVLTEEERRMIETAFFSELTAAEVAERLDQPPDAVKAGIHSGLRKLKQALTGAQP
jgi:RNA polymerase sigma-70 factor (ECF subfamily)